MHCLMTQSGMLWIQIALMIFQSMVRDSIFLGGQISTNGDWMKYQMNFTVSNWLVFTTVLNPLYEISNNEHQIPKCTPNQSARIAMSEANQCTCWKNSLQINRMKQMNQNVPKDNEYVAIQGANNPNHCDFLSIWRLSWSRILIE